MVFPRKIILVTGLVLLSACRNDPIHFHTLMPAHPETVARGRGVEIQFESVSVPPQVDRSQIVIRQGDSGLAILDTEWWAASLSEEMESALRDQLSGPATPHKVSLRLEVQRFDSVLGQYALLDTRWRLRTEAGRLFLTCRTIVQTPSGQEIDDLILSHQRNLKRLAAVIRQTADNLNGGCPPMLEK